MLTTSALTHCDLAAQLGAGRRSQAYRCSDRRRARPLVPIDEPNLLHRHDQKRPHPLPSTGGKFHIEYLGLDRARKLVATVLGVIVAAVALWWQLTKLNQQLTLQYFADYTKRYQEIIQQFPEDVNEAGFKINDREDYQQTMRAMRSYFDLCFEEWYLNQRGFIDGGIWKMWRGGMATAFSKAAFQQAWSIAVRDTRYGADFEKFLTELDDDANNVLRNEGQYPITPVCSNGTENWNKARAFCIASRGKASGRRADDEHVL